MKQTWALIVVLALAVVGIVASLGSDGVSAYSINGHSVSQRDVDAQLRALAEHPEFAKHFQFSRDAQNQPIPVVPAAEGTLPQSVTSGFLTFRIAIDAAQLATSRHLRITPTARHDAERLLGGDAAWRKLPRSSKQKFIDLFARRAALINRVVDSPAVVGAARQACASGRWVSHILVKSIDQANALFGRLQGGADFATVARAASTDSSAADGGALGCYQAGTFAPEFDAYAAAQPVGIVSVPVKTQFGYHLILVRDKPSRDDPDAQNAALTRALAAGQRAKVRLDPRYGRWNAQRRCVMSPATLSTICS